MDIFHVFFEFQFENMTDRQSTVKRKIVMSDSGDEMDDDSDKDLSYDPMEETEAPNNPKHSRIQKILKQQSLSIDLVSSPNEEILSTSSSSTLTPSTSRVDQTVKQTKQKDSESHKSIPRNKSKFSDFFEMEDSSGKDKSAKCKLCRDAKVIKMSGRSTSTIKRHLKNRHSESFRKMFPEEVKPQDRGQMSITAALASSSKLSKPMPEVSFFHFTLNR